jgi:hypothetical protein
MLNKECENVDWAQDAENRIQWWFLVNSIEHLGLINGREFD